MSKRYEKFRKQVGSLLFEDSYVTHGTIDNIRAGHIGDEPEDSFELPLDPAPQVAAQLSQDAPPVDDPEYLPASTQQLAAALSALAKELPDRTDMITSTYEKFRKFVDDNKSVGIEVVDSGGTTSPEEVVEARNIIRTILALELLSEQSLSPTDLYGNRYDPDDDKLGDLDGPTDAELADIEAGIDTDMSPAAPAKKPKKKSAEPTKDESTLSDLAKEMGISVSGVKRLEAEAIKKIRLLMVHFPDDVDGVKEMAMQYFAKGLYELELIDAEEAADLMGSDDAYDLKSFRQFMWDSFLNNVYKKMLRDATKQGISEEDLGTLTPGLADRAKDYFIGLPDSKKMKVLVSSLAAAE